jgi:mevalonate kinase
LEVQRVGSGFDVASAIFGGTLFYQPSRKIEMVAVKDLPLVIGYSGAKVATTKQVEGVESLRSQFPDIIDLIFEGIGRITTLARLALLESNWQVAGKLADINQGLLQSLGVSTPELERPILAARNSGSFGAKLSGAGGGDCMFAIIDEKDRINVEHAIEESGARVLKFATNVEGVRLEPDLDKS